MAQPSPKRRPAQAAALAVPRDGPRDARHGGRRRGWPPGGWPGWSGPARWLLEQGMVAGPVLGLLGALYGFHLAQTAPTAPAPALHATIVQYARSHGHVMHAYYITPAQNALWWLLSAPAILWMLALLGGLVGLGIRSHYRPRDRRWRRD